MKTVHLISVAIKIDDPDKADAEGIVESYLDNLRSDGRCGYAFIGACEPDQEEDES